MANSMSTGQLKEIKNYMLQSKKAKYMICNFSSKLLANNGNLVEIPVKLLPTSIDRDPEVGVA